ncbi:hypothetical protein HDU88_008429 [Geranomyces variabilis]|nr:hypothetical protein HDU88_008429 [Geranomyces variabilis]
MAEANQITPRRRPGATARAGTDLSGFLDRLRATVVAAPPSALGPTPTRPGDALVMRINRDTTRLCAQETQLRELVRERKSLESRLAEDKRVIYEYSTDLMLEFAGVLRLTTAEEQKTMRSAARSLQIWIEQKLADITDPTVLEGVETTLTQVNSEARAYEEFARDLSAKHHGIRKSHRLPLQQNWL